MHNHLIRWFLAAVLGIAGALLGTASHAQQVGPPFFPQTLPSNTVVGRIQAGVGPASAITFQQLQSALSVTCALATTLSPGCVQPDGTTITVSNGIITAIGGGGGSGCTIIGGSVNNIIVNNGVGGCTSALNASANAGTLSLGASGTVGQIVLGNASSGALTLNTVVGPLGSPILSLPAATDTLVGRATTDTLTNKTLNSTTDVIGGVTMTLGSDATGDTYFRNSAGKLTRLGIGSTNQVLTVSGGLPSWQNATGSGGLTVGTTTISSGTTTRILFDNAGVLGEYTLTGTGTTVAMQNAPTFTGIANFTAITSPQILFQGNVSTTAWTTNGVKVVHGTSTLTDTTSSGTVAAAYTYAFGNDTIAATNVTTYTDYFAQFITAPTAGSNVTFTRAWAIGGSGNAQFPLMQLGVPSTTTGSLVLANSASALTTTIQAGNNVTASRTYVWPTNFGAAGSVLTDAAGNGTLSWTTSPASSITVGSSAVVGGTTTRILFDNAGILGEYTLTGTGTVVAMQTAPNFLGTVQIGTASSNTGAIALANASSAFLTTIQAGNASAAKTYTWPLTTGSAGSVLTDAAGNGTLSWAVPSVAALTVNSTVVSGGAAGNMLYTDGSLLQATGGVTWVGTGQLALALGTITTNLKAINITGTWNLAATTFDAPLFMNITNTLSNVNSLLYDFQVGGSSVNSLTATGTLSSSATVQPVFSATTTSTFGPAIILDGTAAGGHKNEFFSTGSSNIAGYFGAFDLTGGQGYLFAANTNNFLVLNAGGYGWANIGVSNAPDTMIRRNGAGIVEIDNGTAGTFRDLTLRHMRGNGAPTANSCTGFVLGTGSSDLAGQVTFNSATTCSITFAAAFTNAPFCTITPGSAASTTEVVSTTGGLTATFGTANTTFSYICMGL